MIPIEGPDTPDGGSRASGHGPLPSGSPDGSPPSEAVDVFGDQLGLASRYAAILAGDGVAHGHIGPREGPRLWERHLLNCALLTDLVSADVRVIDVGSGAGLPGVAMAVRRPDLSMVLVEPMSRRVRFLERVVAELDLPNVTVVRGRADDPSIRRQVGVVPCVVARAVAPLDRLVQWCLPLLESNGRLLALKGRTAQTETVRDADAVRQAGGRIESVVELGVGLVPETTWVVSVGRITDRSPHAAGRKA